MSAWRYWRVYVTLDNGGGGLDIGEIEMRIGTTDQTSPALAAASSLASSTFAGLPAQNAFDDNTATRWGSDFSNTWPQWIRWDFGASPVALDNVRIYPRTLAARSPRNFRIQCSMNAVDWTTAKIVTNEAGWVDSYKQFDFVAPVIPEDLAVAKESTAGAYVVYKAAPSDRVVASTFGAYLAYAPAPTKISRQGLSAAYVVYEMNPNNIPRNSTFAAYVVWATGVGQENRTRSWTYTLDGHTFYVLDLGQEGTFVFDTTTRQWAQFQTAGFSGWNMRVGTMWGENNRIVAGDTLYGTVWEMDPTIFLDEEFRDIEHVATGGVMTRSRVYYSVDELRIAGSLDQYTSGSGERTELLLRFSDDNGETWVAMPNASLDQGELVWRSLGSFMAPGRVFEISDVGGMYRIDGADVYINNFDGQDD